MKTRNNVQKAITKSLAVIISLVLLSITVNAQNFWKTVLENNSFSHIALAMAEVSENSPASADAYTTSNMDAYAEYFVVETEEALDLENWMVNENNFFATVTIETAVESSLELEDWMTNESLFNGTAAYLEVETEQALEVENWMTNTNNFEVPTITVETENEETLEVEAWMTNNKVWEM